RMAAAMPGFRSPVIESLGTGRWAGVPERSDMACSCQKRVDQAFACPSQDRVFPFAGSSAADTLRAETMFLPPAGSRSRGVILRRRATFSATRNAAANAGIRILDAASAWLTKD